MRVKEYELSGGAAVTVYNDGRITLRNWTSLIEINSKDLAELIAGLPGPHLGDLESDLDAVTRGALGFKEA